MRLKVKNFKWLAGRPVVVLHPKTAEKLNVFENDRVCLSNGNEFHSVVDIFPKLVKKNEIGLSYEISKILSLAEGSSIEVSAGVISPASELIRKKIEGYELGEDEIKLIINEILKNNLTEPEIAYFISGQKLSGMTINEIIFLTRAMINNNKGIIRIKKRAIVDKHCIGGVAGNRTTPIVVSICAVAGLVFPKTSSRAITSAAGTADVIETISNIDIDINGLRKVIKKTGACISWGGSVDLAPSDDKIIQVEKHINLDVESQMIASIMSKKISAGANHILIDIPYGQGAKVSSRFQAKILGKKFKRVAEAFGISLKVVYTNGSQPIGNGIGPVLEMLDVISVLQNNETAPIDLREKSLFLSEKLMKLGGIKNSGVVAREILMSGRAYEKFREIINAQNRTNDFEKRVKRLKPARFKMTIKADKVGKIKKIDNDNINLICRILGTPETKSAGVYLKKHIGKIMKNEEIITLYSENKKKLEKAVDYFKKQKVIEII